MTETDRDELEQRRLTSVELSIALRRGAKVHCHYHSGLYVVRVSENDGESDCTTVSVTGLTEREARHSAAQVLKLDREECLEQNARILEAQWKK